MRQILYTLLTGLVLLLLIGGCRQQQSDDRLMLSGETMGTTWSVVLRPAAAVNAAELKQQLQQQLDHINALMSTYDPDSEVSRFNRLSSTDWFDVSDETFQVIELAQEISAQTSGAFDVSVGPLVAIWGFGATEWDQSPPAADQLKEVLASVGYGYLRLRERPPAISKYVSALRIDLSAIAKGYAVDALAKHLDRLQVGNYLVEIGGEMKMAGYRGDGTPWHVAIEKPLEGVRAVDTVFALTDIALATSGNYRNFYEADGQRYGHTIDPASGRPVRHKLASVTVLDPSCARADALATALMVMGEERGKQFSEEHNIAAYFLVHEKTELFSYRSPAFAAHVEAMKP
jgi:thiamine biosynthesis lipoprotein